jgi:hypothetical protein
MAGLTLTVKSNRTREVSRTLTRDGRTLQTVTAEGWRNRARAYVYTRAYRTGELFRSIEVDPARATADSAVRTISISAGVPYATFVHDGTRYMGARPFFRDTLPPTRSGYVKGWHDIGKRL